MKAALISPIPSLLAPPAVPIDDLSLAKDYIAQITNNHRTPSYATPIAPDTSPAVNDIAACGEIKFESLLNTSTDSMDIQVG